MPSPFPGMNPFFEQADIWQDFHNEFLPMLRRHLVPEVAPNYIVQIEEHLYIHDVPSESRRMVRRSDVSMAESFGAGRREAVGVVEAPATLFMPETEVERVPYLEVRDRRDRALVTVIELLSPSNKRPGEDREQYLAKRREVLRSPAHLVEIDLLRGGRPLPPEDRPVSDYSVLVSRAEQRPEAGFWPIGLRDPLPTIPIPLKAPDGDVLIELQNVLNHTYDGPGYEHFIYAGRPDPPLSAEQEQWARSFVPAIG